MITARLVGDDKALARLRALPAGINSGLVRAMTKLGIELQRKVQQEELTGELLASRSGSLRSSIDFRLDQSRTGIAATVFSDSEYAHVHEYGFAGTVSIRASLRRITEAFGRQISEKTINVRAHSRRMNLPQTSFLRTALAEMAPAIGDEVNSALREAVAE